MISSSRSVIFIPLKKEETSENMLLLETPSSTPYSMPTNAVKGVVLRDNGGEIVPKLAYVAGSTPMFEVDIVDLMITIGKGVSSKEKEILNDYKFTFVSKDAILFELHNESW
jgi:hypothetical protein